MLRTTLQAQQAFMMENIFDDPTSHTSTGANALQS
jgi:hypothetical protein